MHRVQRSRLFRSALCVLVLSFASHCPAATFRVGPDTDPDCDFSSLPLALLAAAFTPGTDTILLSTAYDHNGATIPIVDQSVLIEGGFADCDATPSVENATLDGAGNAAGPTLDIACGLGPCGVQFRRITITGGENRNLDIRGQASVFLDDVIVSSSSSDGDGGAIRIDGSDGAHLVTLGITFIGNSSAAGNGGAIACSGTPTRSKGAATFATSSKGVVKVENELELLSTIIANATAINGGGIHLDQGCRMRMSGFDGLAVLTGNVATGTGGALYAGGAAGAVLQGVDQTPIVINANRAERGGAVHATGNGTRVNLINTYIEDNEAPSGGGGVLVSEQARTTMAAFPGGASACAGQQCSRLARNRTQGSGSSKGGGGRVESGGRLVIAMTHVLENEARYGSAFDVLTTNNSDPEAASALQVVSSVVGNNFGSIYVVNLHLSSLSVDGSTFVGNRGSDVNALSSVLHASGNLSGIGGLSVSRSIFDANGSGLAFAKVELTSASIACIVSQGEHASVPLPADSVLADGVLVDPSGNDWRPRPQSPAIDLCTDSGDQYPEVDIRFMARGVDDPSVPDASGTYDAGAYETGDGAVFGDGFESL